jgi:2-methylisocitrate lyase-like PEP mutase family enzyme
MAWSGAPSVAALAAAGVVRISLGSAIAEAAYAVARRATVELLTLGTYDSTAEGIPYGEANAAMAE